jgi:hypothetical protein
MSMLLKRSMPDSSRVSSGPSLSLIRATSSFHPLAQMHTMMRRLSGARQTSIISRICCPRKAGCISLHSSRETYTRRPRRRGRVERLHRDNCVHANFQEESTQSQKYEFVLEIGLFHLNTVHIQHFLHILPNVLLRNDSLSFTDPRDLHRRKKAKYNAVVGESDDTSSP